MNTMLLHAESIKFAHPISGEELEINANTYDEFERVLGLTELKSP